MIFYKIIMGPSGVIAGISLVSTQMVNQEYKESMNTPLTYLYSF